jgi:hypothetical protein
LAAQSKIHGPVFFKDFPFSPFLSLLKLLFCFQVSDRIIGLACFLYDCDSNDNVHFVSLRVGGRILKDVSGINTRGWGPMNTYETCNNSEDGMLPVNTKIW